MSYTVPDTVTCSVTVSNVINTSITPTGVSPTENNSTIRQTQGYEKGAGAGQVNVAATALLTIPNGSSLDVYLSSGTPTLVDLFNQPAIFARIKSMTLTLLDANDGGSATAKVTVGGGTNPFVGPLGGTTPTHEVQNGGTWHWDTPDATAYAVTNGSNDRLHIANATGTDGKVRLTVFGSAS